MVNGDFSSGFIVVLGWCSLSFFFPVVCVFYGAGCLFLDYNSRPS